MKDRNRRMNRRNYMRFSVEAGRIEPVLIEQRIIRALVWIIALMFAWPLMAANRYTDSQRYRQAKYIEVVDIGIWMGAFFLELAWVIAVFATIITLSSGA